MKRFFVLSSAAAAMAISFAASAQSTPAPTTPSPASTATATAPASPHTVTGNFALVSDYKFRGISQTDRGPAIQGGIDYSHSSGFYLGNWTSSIASDLYPNAAGVEMDFYGGFKPTIGDVTLDIGALYYYYPHAKIDGQDFNTLEVYLGAAYGPISGKVWYGASDEWFGVDSASGSLYYELNGTFPLVDKLSLVAHVGYQDVNDNSDADYWDYKLGLTYDLSGWLLGAAVVGAKDDDDFYGRYADTTVVVSVGKTF